MRTAGVAETATANTSRALPVLWTCGQGSPTKSTHTRPRARRPAAPAPTPPRGVRRPPRTLTEGAAPTGGRGRPTWGPSWGGGAQRKREPTAQQVRLLRPAWPHSGLSDDPSRAGHGRHWDPCSPSGACAPPGGAALFPETEPRERDAQPATGGRERARPPSGRAWLGP